MAAEYKNGLCRKAVVRNLPNRALHSALRVIG